MIELKVTLENINTPNDVVKFLNEMLTEMSFILPIIRVRAVSNGNHIGYGLVQIIEQQSTPLNNELKSMISILVQNIVVEFHKSDKVKLVEVFHGKDELTDYFLYNYNIIGGIEKDNYITIERQ